jgi:hypothetical protein
MIYVYDDAESSAPPPLAPLVIGQDLVGTVNTLNTTLSLLYPTNSFQFGRTNETQKRNYL